MIYCRVDPASAATDTVASGNIDTTSSEPGAAAATDPKHMKRIIKPDGSIELVHDENAKTDSKSFRKGMLPLRDMKMSWTLAEFVSMDNQFVFKISQQKERWVGKDGVSLDQNSANAFQSYLRTFAFQRQRFGFLYGKFVEEEMSEEEKNKLPKNETLFGTELPGTEIQHVVKNQKVLVEAIYEPPQEVDGDGFVALEDPMEEKVEALAEMLGLRKVGWIFGHPPREVSFEPLSIVCVLSWVKRKKSVLI